MNGAADQIPHMQQKLIFSGFSIYISYTAPPNTHSHINIQKQ